MIRLLPTFAFALLLCVCSDSTDASPPDDDGFPFELEDGGYAPSDVTGVPDGHWRRACREPGSCDLSALSGVLSCWCECAMDGEVYEAPIAWPCRGDVDTVWAEHGAAWEEWAGRVSHCSADQQAAGWCSCRCGCVDIAPADVPEEPAGGFPACDLAGLTEL